MSLYHPTVEAQLARLGFVINTLINKHPVYNRLSCRPVGHSNGRVAVHSDQTRVVLEIDLPSNYEGRLPHYKTFDMANPRWQQTMFTYFNRATFLLAEINAANAAREAAAEQIRRDREAIVLSVVGEGAPIRALERIFQIGADVESNSVKSVSLSYFARLEQTDLWSSKTTTERAEAAGRVVRMLIAEGLLPLDPKED